MLKGELFLNEYKKEEQSGWKKNRNVDDYYNFEYIERDHLKYFKSSLRKHLKDSSKNGCRDG